MDLQRRKQNQPLDDVWMLGSLITDLFCYLIQSANNCKSFPDGNGFKTSTMRLGADVIVFSRHFDKRSALIITVSLTYVNVQV